MNQELLNFSLINIDKPGGPTSFTVSDFVRRKLKLKKTSHMGTLDPKVTGVLPITLGRACKLADYFIHHDKTYKGILHTHSPQEMKKLQELIDKNFIGKIKQLPPKRSAVKRAVRERTVHSFKFLRALEGNKKFEFETCVEGGTYIRKICSDLGEKIGGAHMGALKRTAAGIFDESTTITLDEFEDLAKRYIEGKDEELEKHLVRAEDAIKKVLPYLQVEKRALKGLLNGRPVLKKDIIGDSKVKTGDSFALFEGEQFVGVYKKTAEKGIFGRAEFVKSPTAND